MTPSRQWRSLQGVWPFRREIVQKFVDSLDFEYLRRIAEATRGNSAFSAKVHKHPFSAGRERLVFQIEFSDGTLWVARVTLPPLPAAQDDPRLLPCPDAAVMLSEVATIRLVSSETSIPVPQIHAHAFQTNPFGAPYMLMDEVAGQFIRPFPSTPIQDIPHVYSQVAEIVLTLAQVTFAKVGMLTENAAPHNRVVSKCLFHDLTVGHAFSTATEYYTMRFRRFLTQKKKEVPPDDDWVVFAWLCLQSIPYFILIDLDEGPFPLSHPDLNNGNILYDEQNTIVGVIDWTACGTFPWEIAMSPPLDLVYFDERRTMYIDIFEAKEVEITGTNRFASFMRSPRARIVNLINENFEAYGRMFPIQRALELAMLVFGEDITWGDVKMRYKESEEGQLAGP